MNEREIFLAALAITDSAVRAAFLESVCKHDVTLRSRIGKLLSAHEASHALADRLEQIVGSQLQAAEAEARVEGIAPPHAEIGVTETPTWFAWLRPGARLGRYEIARRIGAGGMGEVFAANDTQLNRIVALKLLAPIHTRNKNWLHRFQREARAASALNHPNILTVYEIAESDGVQFIATEYIEGTTLRKLLSEKPLELSRAVGIAAQIAWALSAAHSASIVHRDIKPDNVMVRPDGLVKVLDFGLAKQLGVLSDSDPSANEVSAASGRTITTPGVLIGTFRYMSPEQARGADVDTRSDIFSLGVILFEMIAGRQPFNGATPSDVLASILEHQAPALRRFQPDAPEELERIISKCLRKDREERYQSAKDLYLDLKHLQNQLEQRANPSFPSRQAIGYGPFASQTERTKHPDSTVVPDDVPEVRYTRSGDVNIAYQVIGHGTIDLVFVMGWVSHLEWFWKERSFQQFLSRLATFARVILFDKRGTGLSDRVPIDQLPTLEQRMDDVRAVMEAVGSERAVLCGISEGGPMCSLFAATYPEKTIALVMMGSYARRMWAPDYPWGPTEEQRERFFEEIRRDWGGPVGIDVRAPSKAQDPAFRDWWGTYLRMGASPGAALALTRMNAQIDIRPILPAIRVPTLVIHRRDDRCLLVDEGRYLAERIPGAKFVELPGNDHLPFVGDQNAILDEIEEFLTGMRHSHHVDRILATVLAAQVVPVSSASLTGHSKIERAAIHHAHAVREIELFKGKVAEINSDGILATFDGPARAIRAAMAIGDTSRRLGIRLQTGLHTGECDFMDNTVSGLAVDLARQLANQAKPDQILVSNTVKDLVAGAGIQFETCVETSLPDEFRDSKIYWVKR